MTMFKQVSFTEEEGVAGFWGIINLNRPEAYNALSHEMILHISAQLHRWAKQKYLLGVMIHSDFDKAFCAGGDIRALYDQGKRGDVAALKAFFKDEYNLNHQIYAYSKPWISFIHGITMGGGAGISIHGRHRVASENLRFAMPECGIGFFPDIGGSYFLSRCPGELGTYLALVGATIGTADALYCGLVDHCIAHQDYTGLKAQLLQTDFSKTADPNGTITAILNQHAYPCVPPTLSEHRASIDYCFQGGCVETILGRLQQDASLWCQEVAVALQQKSPLSLKVTLEQLRRGRILDLSACLQMEYGLAQHFAMDRDFYEGVRAQIIDKDRMPRWQPPTLAAVGDDKIKMYFNTATISQLELSGGK